ncbi:hypothetical protein Btru_020197 [Bulinus truncatus]|nr:hypothetical protein Btru_020197 [Bulinus truncatus]
MFLTYLSCFPRIKCICYKNVKFLRCNYFVLLQQMHLLGKTEGIFNDNKTNMSGVAADFRLRRQVPVTSKPSLKLRLTSRAAAHQQQQPSSRERSSSWHPDIATLSVFKNSTSTLKTGSKAVPEISQKNVAQSSISKDKSDFINGNKLVIHHQRQNLKNRFQLLKTLGEGTYGKVKLASDKTTSEQVAIKYIKKTKIQDENDLARIRREIHILSSLRHKHIVNIREGCILVGVSRNEFKGFMQDQLTLKESVSGSALIALLQVNVLFAIFVWTELTRLFTGSSRGTEGGSNHSRRLGMSRLRQLTRATSCLVCPFYPDTTETTAYYA